MSPFGHALWMFASDLFAVLVPVVPFALRTLGIAAAAGLAGVAVGALLRRLPPAGEIRNA